jgi:O-antigen ligase
MSFSARLILSLFALLIALFLSSVTAIKALAALVFFILFVVAFSSVRYTLYILVFSMLLSPELIVGETPAREITIRLDDIFLLILLISWLTKTAIYKELGLLRFTSLNRPILLYASLAVLSTMIGLIAGRVNLLSGFFFTLKYLEFFLFFFLVINNVTDIKEAKKFTTAILITCFIVTLFALYQVPSGERITAPFEGKYGGEPNTLGGYLIIMLSIIISLYITHPYFRFKRLLIPLAILIVFSLAYTQSRGSWLGLIAMTTTFIIFSKKRIIFSLVTAILILSMPYITPEVAQKRAKGTFIGEPGFKQTEKIFGITFDPSASERIACYKNAFKRWVKHPIMGYGVTGAGFVDTQYIRLLLETGIVGFILFIYVIYTLFKNLLTTYRTTDELFIKSLSLGMMAAIFGLMGHSITASTFIIVRIMEPFWFLSGLAMIPIPSETSHE